ncbi:hypothetical protein [Actinoplanes sp. NPDC051494]|uniref:hypothetical protein n=1 Tax=Actinoplanes sp. NPDC051494 TaxID=3363907 RepID=UPI0037B845AB
MIRIGGPLDVAWIVEQTGPGLTVTSAIPPVFEAYATFHAPEDVPVMDHERAVVAALLRHTIGQPWWLGYLETGAHDVVFADAPRVLLYSDWPYVLAEAGPEQALTWRTGHMRDGNGALPDLFFPADRSWLVSALWDDTWSCLGGPATLIDDLRQDPLVNAHRVDPGEDALPPGLDRE